MIVKAQDKIAVGVFSGMFAAFCIGVLFLSINKAKQ